MGDYSDPLRELARISRMEVAEVRRYYRAGIVEVEAGSLTETTVRRLRRARRLRRDLGLELDAIAIIIRLLDQLEHRPGA